MDLTKFKFKRVSVYKQALKMLIREYKELPKVKDYQDAGLCILLPCLLWNLKGYMSDAPNGEDWDWCDTPNMFPEIKRWISKIKFSRNPTTIRIKCIESAIKKLSK